MGLLVPCSFSHDSFLFPLVTAAGFSTYSSVEDSNQDSEVLHERDSKQKQFQSIGCLGRLSSVTYILLPG